MSNTKYILFLVVITLFVGCSADNSQNTRIKTEKLSKGQSLTDIIHSPINQDGAIDTINLARMDFEQAVFYFGEVEEGEIIEHTFYFTNSGKQALLIKDALSTCGCTVPTYPKTLIETGSRDSIMVKFDTKNKLGIQNKGISLIANTYPNKTIVYLKGKVKERK